MSPPDAKSPPRIVSVAFVSTAPFADEATAARPGAMGNCLAVVPARIDRDGSAVPIDEKQRADGMLVIRQSGAGRVSVFVPWSNIRGVVYG